MSIDYKLSDAECKDLCNCKIKHNGNEYSIEKISYLPWGHLVSLKDNGTHRGSIILWVTDTEKGRKIETAPLGNSLAERFREKVVDYFKITKNINKILLK